MRSFIARTAVISAHRAPSAYTEISLALICAVNIEGSLNTEAPSIAGMDIMKEYLTELSLSKS